MTAMVQDMVVAPASTLRVGVVATYSSVRAGLRSLIEQDERLTVAFDESALPAAPSLAEDLDVLVVDLAEGAALDEAALATPIVILGEPNHERYAPRPAAAYLDRDASGPELLAAVHAVVEGLAVFDAAFLPLVRRPVRGSEQGGDPLTPRELDVLRLVADGLTNKAIARELGISDHTAKFHVGAILAKLGAESRTEAVSLAARSGLLPL